jgi:hypothetical protein
MSFDDMGLEMKWIALIFKRFNRIYLDKWTDKFLSVKSMEDHMEEWSIGIQNLTPAQIKQGIDRCRVKKIWPPGIAEFISCATEGEILHQGEAYRIWHALPSPKRDPDLAKRVFSEMRSCLR